MEGHEAATRAADVALPVEVVELKHLRTLDGGPVRVLCGGCDELVIQAVVKVLPGAFPKGLESDEDDAGTGVDLSHAERLKAIAVPLLEAGTAFSDGNGGEVRPAFYWNPEKRVAGSINGRMLRIEDLDRLVVAVLRAGRYVAAPGGGPESGDFHDAGRGGAPVRVEPVPTGEGHGVHAVGSGSRPASAVQRKRAARAR